MPRAVDVAEPEALEISVTPTASPTRRPLVKAQVVYLGSRRNYSIPMKGRIRTERLPTGHQDAQGDDEMAERKDVTASGFQPYDFTTHDQLGRRYEAKYFIKSSHPNPTARGKRFVICEHPDHLWRFASMLDKDKEPMFLVFPYRGSEDVIKEYFASKARASSVQKKDFSDITAQGG